MDYWFRCPSCEESRFVTDEQAHAREQIVCGCGKKQTGRVTPLIPSTDPLPHSEVFTIERDRIEERRRRGR